MNKYKEQTRQDVSARRDALTAEDIKEKSGRIAHRLFCLPAYRKAVTVMFFLAFGNEVDTLSMVPQSLSHGKKVVAPKTVQSEKKMLLSQISDLREDTAPGQWGIPEPKEERLCLADPREIDLVIVPGIAFDEEGNRLGYGGGYYDRFFPQLRQGVPLVALAFELQILPRVIAEPWDQAVDTIITEDRLISCEKNIRGKEDTIEKANKNSG